MSCPLCLSSEIELFHVKDDVHLGHCEYFKCVTCDLVFLNRDQCLDFCEQKTIYDSHENSPESVGYVAFLRRLYDPFKQLLPVKASGIDFGCGPGPTLSGLAIKDGFCCVDYDPIYFPNDHTLKINSYDFVMSTETIEHFNALRETCDQVMGLIKRGGLLGLMTELRDSSQDFKNWHYHRDPTHVNFFSKQTMRWLGNHYNYDLLCCEARVVIFRKL